MTPGELTWAVKLEDQQIAASTGSATTLDEAKAAIQNAWATWLKFAGLIG